MTMCSHKELHGLRNIMAKKSSQLKSGKPAWNLEQEYSEKLTDVRESSMFRMLQHVRGTTVLKTACKGITTRRMDIDKTLDLDKEKVVVDDSIDASSGLQIASESPTSPRHLARVPQGTTSQSTTPADVRGRQRDSSSAAAALLTVTQSDCRVDIQEKLLISDEGRQASSPPSDLQREQPAARFASAALGLAMGGKLIQDIARDASGSVRRWDMQSAVKFNVHFMSPAFCKAITHIVSPPPAMTLKEYVELGNWFYVVEEDEEARLAGGGFDNVLSVSQMNAQKLSEQSYEGGFNPLLPQPCRCDKRLTDCVMRPCGCAMCNICVRGMGGKCKSCGKEIMYVAGFSAPMSLPGEEGKGRYNVEVEILWKDEKGKLSTERNVKRRL